VFKEEKKKKKVVASFSSASRRDRERERESSAFWLFSSLAVRDSTHQSYSQQKPFWHINRFPIKDFDPETKIN
jgi:hypothetical protein